MSNVSRKIYILHDLLNLLFISVYVQFIYYLYCTSKLRRYGLRTSPIDTHLISDSYIINISLRLVCVPFTNAVLCLSSIHWGSASHTCQKSSCASCGVWRCLEMSGDVRSLEVLISPRLPWLAETTHESIHNPCHKYRVSTKTKKFGDHCTPSLLAPSGARYERQRSEIPSRRGATLLCLWHSTRFNTFQHVSTWISNPFRINFESISFNRAL